MDQFGKPGVIVQFVLLIAAVVALSFVSTRLWGGKPEKLPEDQPVIVDGSMTVAEFGEKNGLPRPVMKSVFGLQTKADLQKKIEDFGLTAGQLEERVSKAMALAAEHETKNWQKILLKFALWFIFLGLVFALMRKGRIKPSLRKWLYLGGAALFGVILGADPSPMGTVKDAIALFGARGAIFPPRMIALSVFLLTVVLANKFICSWGCQFGVLQDLLFRLNRESDDRMPLFPQFKIPFVVSNGFRVLFFGVFTAIAFVWAFDIVEPIDPFKVFKPQALMWAGGVFLGAVLIGSLFVYRPWCSLFCPFGFVGWVFEKISVFKINVDYDTCIACGSCSRNCPSTVMEAILKQETVVIPDCFACGTCIDVCPTNSIQFQAGKRNRPPEGKFDQVDEDEHAPAETH
jgi:polyferredoxin